MLPRSAPLSSFVEQAAVSAGQGAQASFKDFSRLVERASGAQGTRGDGVDHRKQVLAAMFLLTHQQLQLLV